MTLAEVESIVTIQANTIFEHEKRLRNQEKTLVDHERYLAEIVETQGTQNTTIRTLLDAIQKLSGEMPPVDSEPRYTERARPIRTEQD